MRWASRIRRRGEKADDNPQTSFRFQYATETPAQQSNFELDPTVPRVFAGLYAEPIVQEPIAHITPTLPDSFTRNQYQPAAINIPPGSTISSEQAWIDQVQNSQKVQEFLAGGNYPDGVRVALESLRQATVTYLKDVGLDHIGPSSERDECLAALIDLCTQRYPSTKILAIAACLKALSAERCAQLLRPVGDEDLGPYLRCLTLARHVIPDQDYSIAKSLVIITTEPSQVVGRFRPIIETVAASARLRFVPPPVIHAVLKQAGFEHGLQAEVESHLDVGRLWTAFQLVKWLKAIPDISQNRQITAILDRHLRSWRSYLAWRPNESRIQIWESRNLEKHHVAKILPLLKLDGPGNTTARRYDHVKLEPEDAEQLERFLDLLSQSHCQGAKSLDLFIFMCIDSTANERSLLLVEEALQKGDDKYCLLLLSVMRAVDSRSPLIRRLEDLGFFLPLISSKKAVGDLRISVQHLAKIISSTLKLGQESFCRQLERVVPQRLCELLYGLSKAVLQASWLHSDLDPTVLAYIQELPSHAEVSNLFGQLEDGSGLSEAMRRDITSYLIATIGGRVEPERNVSLGYARDELQFWSQQPNNLKRDLAKMIQTMEGVDYDLYTSCLGTISHEDDLFLGELKALITGQSNESCVAFIRYLAHRRKLGQLLHNCWLLLAETLIKLQGPTMLPQMADSLQVDDWMELAHDLSKTLAPVLSQSAKSEGGLSKDTISWWGLLANHRETIHSFQKQHGKDATLGWLYFPSSKRQILDLLTIAQDMATATTAERQILQRLQPKGTNASLVCQCIEAFSHTTSTGGAVFERILSRAQTGEWADTGLSRMVSSWRQSRLLGAPDKSALKLLEELLGISGPGSVAESTTTKRNLEAEYAALMAQAKDLETVRWKLRRQDAKRAKGLLKKFKIRDDGKGGVTNGDIPNGLIDIVETVGDGVYELAFSLMDMNKMHRQARGVPENARMVVVRVQQRPSSQFCVHILPQDDSVRHHKMWSVASNGAPDSAVCSSRRSLFAYYLCRQLHNHLRSGLKTLQGVHDCVQGLISKAPANCLVCCGNMPTKLWKPSACSVNCSVSLRRAPLEVRLHNLLVDPMAIDLLLTSIFAAVADANHGQLLAGCPVQFTRVQMVINSIPPLSQLQTATDLRTALAGADIYAKEREDLLSWMCLNFRGFLLSAPTGFVVPSMPGTIQFILPNSHHEHEQVFNAQPGAQNSSGIIFHGTPMTRLWSILSGGLKVMSNSPLMIHGASHGSGVYCGEEPSASLGYSNSNGQSWTNSALRNYKPLLGCQLAGYTASSRGYHVVADANRLIVRYVFMVPLNFKGPIRAHVVGAMTMANSAFRSGLLT
jgi:hypothetical protein